MSTLKRIYFSNTPLTGIPTRLTCSISFPILLESKLKAIAHSKDDELNCELNIAPDSKKSYIWIVSLIPFIAYPVNGKSIEFPCTIFY